MALGIPGSEGNGGSGSFLGRIQFDARTGFWQIVKRVQDRDGSWGDDKSEPFKGPQFLMDMGGLEVGYIKFSSPPAFVLVPYGKPVPPQPEELSQDPTGRKKKAFQPGFRVKIMSPKTFGDADAYTFAHASKTVLDAMDEFHMMYETMPEAALGKIPLVSAAENKRVTFKTPQGENTFYAPKFTILSWHDRPETFGERTVPAPAARAPVAPPPVAHAQPAPGTWGAPSSAPIAPPPPAAHVSAAAPPTMPEW